MLYSGGARGGGRASKASKRRHGRGLELCIHESVVWGAYGERGRCVSGRCCASAAPRVGLLPAAAGMHMRCGVVGQWWLCFLAASKQLAAGLWTSATGSAWGVARGAGRS